MNLMVITNPKPIINTQITKRKELKHNTKKAIKSQGKRAREEERNGQNYKNIQKKSNKMAIGTFLSMATLNVNGLNVPIKMHRVANSIK